MGSKKTTTTPTNPAWSTNLVSGLAGKVSDLGNLDPYSLIAGSNPLLDKAQSSLMAGLDPQISKLLSSAGSAGSVGQHSGLDNLDKWKNPYLQDVLDSSLKDYDYEAGRQTAQTDLDLANDNAFAGSGAALTKSMLGGQLARGRGALSSGIRSDAWNTAAQYGSQDADRALQADSTNAQLHDAAAGRSLQAAGLLGNLNSQMTGQQMSLGDYLRQMEQEKLQAPISLLGTQASLAGGLPLNLFSGSKTKTSGGTLGAIGSGLLGAGMMAGGLGWKPFG